MDKKWNIICVGGIFFAVMFNQTSLAASSIGEAITIVADRLEAEPGKSGVRAGKWRREEDFTGSIVAGIPGDLDLDGGVNSIDHVILANNWRAFSCGGRSWCDSADIDQSRSVDFADFEIMVDNWLKGTSQ